MRRQVHDQLRQPSFDGRREEQVDFHPYLRARTGGSCGGLAEGASSAGNTGAQRPNGVRHTCTKRQMVQQHCRSAFPSLADIGSVLDSILDHLNVKTCVGIGEGAGANIICRFAVSAQLKERLCEHNHCRCNIPIVLSALCSSTAPRPLPVLWST